MRQISHQSFKRVAFVALALVSLISAGYAHAEQKQLLDKYEVHYMVVNSTFFTPEVARQYELVRSRYNAIVNIAVLDKDTHQALDVAVSGKATNLIGTAKALKFKKVKEGESIYYLASLSVDDAETYRFAIDIQVGDDVKQLTFQQKIFLD